MTLHELIMQGPPRTLKECDAIIEACEPKARGSKRTDGTVRVVEATINWHETYALRDNDELTSSEILITCSHCMNDQVVDLEDNGIQRCARCERKLMWKEIRKREQKNNRD